MDKFILFSLQRLRTLTSGTDKEKHCGKGGMAEVGAEKLSYTWDNNSTYCDGGMAYARYHDSCSRVRGYGLPAWDRGGHGRPNDSGIDSLSTGPLARPFARTAHSFACSRLLALLAPSAALTSSLAPFAHGKEVFCMK